MSTVAQIEGLIKRYQTYYQVAGVSKNSKKEEIIGKLLRVVRPQSGKLVLAPPVWTDSIAQDPVFMGLPDPTPEDVAILARLSVPKLLSVTKTYNDYYEIIKNYRDVAKPVKEAALSKKVAPTASGLKDTMPPFALDLETLSVKAGETAPTAPTAPAPTPAPPQVALPIETPAFFEPENPAFRQAEEERAVEREKEAERFREWQRVRKAEEAAALRKREEAREEDERNMMGSEDTQGVDKLRAKVVKSKADKAAKDAADKAAKDAADEARWKAARDKRIADAYDNIESQNFEAIDELQEFAKNPHARCYDKLCSMSKPHEKINCPTLNVLYCPVCASKGHGPNTCPNKTAWHTRQALGPIPPGLKDKEIYVRDTPDGVANVLKEAGLVPTSPAEDKKTLRRLVNILPGGPRLLLYLPNSYPKVDTLTL